MGARMSGPVRPEDERIPYAGENSLLATSLPMNRGIHRTRHPMCRRALTTLTALTKLAAPLLIVSHPVSAQSGQPISGQGAVLATAIYFNGKNVGGVGIEVQGRANHLVMSPGGALSLGLGLQATGHVSGGDRIALTGAFLEPRYVFVLASERWFPYAAARVAALRQHSNFLTPSNGGAAGAGGGVIYAVSKRVNLDLGAAAVYQSFGDATYTRPGVRFGQPARFRPFVGYAAKFGANVGFGNPRR
jgi:hypothetical protein